MLMLIFASMKRLTGILLLLASCFCALGQQQAQDAYATAEEQFYKAQYGAAIRTSLEGLQQ